MKIEIYLGVEKDHDGEPIDFVVLAQALNALHKGIEKRFGGFTSTDAIGSWEGMRERSVIITVISDGYTDLEDVEKVHPIIDDLAHDFLAHTNQACVLTHYSYDTGNCHRYTTLQI